MINTLIFVSPEGYTPLIDRVSALFQEKEINFNLLTDINAINPNQMNLVYVKEYPNSNSSKHGIISSIPKTAMYFPREEHENATIELSEDLTQLNIQGKEIMIIFPLINLKEHLINKTTTCKTCRL